MSLGAGDYGGPLPLGAVDRFHHLNVSFPVPCIQYLLQKGTIHCGRQAIVSVCIFFVTAFVNVPV